PIPNLIPKEVLGYVRKVSVITDCSSMINQTCLSGMISVGCGTKHYLSFVDAHRLSSAYTECLTEEYVPVVRGYRCGLLVHTSASVRFPPEGRNCMSDLNNLRNFEKLTEKQIKY
ncbi:hypothetical protein J6590_089267, partial [Homalodisca vitripennis]